MKIILTIFLTHIMCLTYAQGQMDSIKLITIDFTEYCNDNFSSQRDDSSFVNYYISNNKDTMFFKAAPCIQTAEPSTPPTFRRRVLNGWAEGDLQVYHKKDSTYTWSKGSYLNGVLIKGSYTEYYDDDTALLKGQYVYGNRYGVWNWYFPNGKVKLKLAYEMGEPIQQIEYDLDGEIIELYDVVKEKAQDNKTPN